MSVSIIVPTIPERIDELTRLLDSCRDLSRKPKEILIVAQDVSDTDAYAQRVAPYHHSLSTRIIYLTERNLPAARNHGVTEATGEYIAFLDDDIILDDTYVERIESFFSSHPSALGVQGVITNFTEGHTKKVGGRGFVYRLYNAFAKVFQLNNSSTKNKVLASGRSQYASTVEDITEAQWLSGIGAYKKNVFVPHQFDESLGGYALGEDKLFSYALSKQYPGTLFIDPSITCRHEYGVAGRPASNEWVAMKVRNTYYFWDMHVRSRGIYTRLAFFWASLGDIVVALLSVFAGGKFFSFFLAHVREYGRLFFRGHRTLAQMHNKPHVFLFFTYGVSLDIWKQAGTLDRDIKLYQELQLRGKARVTLVTYGKTHNEYEYAQNAGMSHVIYNRWKLPTCMYYLWLPVQLFFTGYRPTHIKSHQFIGVWPAVLFSKIRRACYIARGGYLPTYFFVREKGHSLKGRLKSLFVQVDEWLLARTADIIFVPSSEEEGYLRSRHTKILAETPIVHQPNWIDTDLFQPLAVEKKRRSVLFLGRCEAQKQPLLFLEAIMDIPDCHITFIGAGSMEAAVQAYIQAHDIDVLHITDRLQNEDLPQIFSEHSVYVLPSLYEGGSAKTVLEAMACGVPVVVTDVFGLRALVEHEQQGLVSLESAEALRSSIQRLLDNSHFSETLGKQARKRIIEKYSLEAVLAREISFLE